MVEIEEPAWLTAKIDQRLARMTESLDVDINELTNFALLLLTEPPDDASPEEVARWEYTCDNCGTYCPEPVPFFTGHSIRFLGPTQVAITYGICGPCKELE